MKWDARRFESPIERVMRRCWPRPENEHSGFETLPIKPADQLDQTPLGAADIKLCDAKRDPSWSWVALMFHDRLVSAVACGVAGQKRMINPSIEFEEI